MNSPPISKVVSLYFGLSNKLIIAFATSSTKTGWNFVVLEIKGKKISYMIDINANYLDRMDEKPWITY